MPGLGLARVRPLYDKPIFEISDVANLGIKMWAIYLLTLVSLVKVEQRQTEKDVPKQGVNIRWRRIEQRYQRGIIFRLIVQYLSGSIARSRETFVCDGFAGGFEFRLYERHASRDKRRDVSVGHTLLIRVTLVGEEHGPALWLAKSVPVRMRVLGLAAIRSWSGYPERPDLPDPC